MCHSRVEIGEVEYRDYSTHTIPMNNVYGPALFKRDSFQHERELRVATLNMRRATEAGRPTVASDGFPVEVDLDILIERVVVSPKSPGWMVEMIRKLLLRYGIHKPIEWSPLYTLNRISGET